MKTLRFLFCTLFCSVSLLISAQSADNQYNGIMEKALMSLDSIKNVQDLQKARNQFERIANKYTNEWLPLYYVVYSDLQMVYFEPGNKSNKSILEEAESLLKNLEKMNNTDQSELSTLKGYYFCALIVNDPQNNGPKYYNDVSSNYKNAIKQNNTNPRPLFLLALYEQNLPAFLKSGNDFCDELKKADKLYDLEVKSINKPYWGRYFLNQLMSQCKK